MDEEIKENPKQEPSEATSVESGTTNPTNENDFGESPESLGEI